MVNKIPGVRLDPFPAFNFYIALIDSSSALGKGRQALNLLMSIGASVAGGFSECSGLECTLQVQEYPEGGQNNFVHKFPTRMTYANITLKRGITFLENLWNWHYEYATGKGKRRDGLIILADTLKLPGPQNLPIPQPSAGAATALSSIPLPVPGSSLPGVGPGAAITPVKIWRFKKGLPLKWSGPTLNATQNAVAVESIEIMHQGLELWSPGTGLARAISS